MEKGEGNWKRKRTEKKEEEEEEEDCKEFGELVFADVNRNGDCSSNSILNCCNNIRNTHCCWLSKIKISGIHLGHAAD